MEITSDIILKIFISPFYYGREFLVVLPMTNTTTVKIIQPHEKYSPTPYAVARYRLVDNSKYESVYEFQGVEIRNND